MKKGLASLVLGCGLLIGCEGIKNYGKVEPETRLLDEMVIKGDVKVQLIQEVEGINNDRYRTLIYNSKEELVAEIVCGKIQDSTRIYHDDGKMYVIKDGTGFYLLSEKKNENVSLEK